jgi:ribosome-associated protein
MHERRTLFRFSRGLLRTKLDSPRNEGDDAYPERTDWSDALRTSGESMTFDKKIDTAAASDRALEISQAPSSTVVAHKIGDIILDKKGSDLLVLGVERITSLADYLVIATGSNSRQLYAMAVEIEQAAKELGVGRCRAEGLDQGWWIVIDCGDVIVHIMQEEARRFYNLEMLWADGRVVRRSADVA